MNAEAADMWVMEVVIPEKEERKTALSALRAWGDSELLYTASRHRHSCESIQALVTSSVCVAAVLYSSVV